MSDYFPQHKTKDNKQHAGHSATKDETFALKQQQQQLQHRAVGAQEGGGGGMLGKNNK